MQEIRKPPSAIRGAAPCGRVFWIALIFLAAAGAAAFRLPRLTQRPMHCDEAVHAYKFGQLLDHGYYRYNSYEFHGPTLNYLTLPAAWLSGAPSYARIDEATLRIVPVVFGTLTVVLLLLVGDGLGRWAAVGAAVLTAVSTAMVFYSRYYIQETLLVCFTLAAVAGAWRYVRSGRLGWCILAGAGFGLMHATKETWVLAAAAMGFSLAVNAALNRWAYGQPPVLRARVVNWRLAVGVAAGLAVAALFLSSFFTNANGPLDSLRTFVYCLRRAGGQQEGGNLHVHPWDFYLRVLFWTHDGRGPFWSEAFIAALAVAGAAAGFVGRGLGGGDGRFIRFLALYSLALLGVYCLIPYKTPWCVLGPLHGMILLAGVGAAMLLRLPVWFWRAALKGAGPEEWLLVRWTAGLVMQLGVALILAAGAAQLGVQAYRGSYKFYCDERNPYVYAHTLRDAVRLGQRAEEIAAVHPAGRNMVIKFYSPDAHDQWPLPWYLRRLNQDRIGFYLHVPDEPDADIIIFVPEVWKQLEPRLRQEYEWEHRGLRPGIVLKVGVRKELWKRYIDGIRARQGTARR